MSHSRANQKLNSSVENIQQLQSKGSKEGSHSLMKLTGSSILGATQRKNKNYQSNRTIDYKILPDDYGKTADHNPYGSISVNDMLAREAKAQFDGSCAKYPVPDTRPMLYKIHGQVDLSLNKKPKMTYIDEIMDRAKKPERRVPGPSDYKGE